MIHGPIGQEQATFSSAEKKRCVRNNAASAERNFSLFLPGHR
jgi:hypothetical protein